MEIFHPTLDYNKMKVFLSPKLRDFEIEEVEEVQQAVLFLVSFHFQIRSYHG